MENIKIEQESVQTNFRKLFKAVKAREKVKLLVVLNNGEIRIRHGEVQDLTQTHVTIDDEKGFRTAKLENIILIDDSN